MSNDLIISVQDLGKKFSRSLKRMLVHGVQDVYKDVFCMASPQEVLRPAEFWALKDITFEILPGECLGVIGDNGAGKSTLLKLLNGVILPDKGMVRVRGKTGGLLELGAGFHPMLTGCENIHLSAAILGLAENEINEKFDTIVEFSGLRDFINSPVKYYSSGMYVRLGFAIAVHADPDVLLIDESLAVGDLLFQKKCFAKFREFKQRGATIIIVTHDLTVVTSHCSRALLLDKGRLVRDGTPKEVVAHYNRIVTGRDRPLSRKGTCISESAKGGGSSDITEWDNSFLLNPNEDRYGSKRAEIVEAGIFDLENSPVQMLERNREYLIKVKVRHNESMAAAIVAFMVADAKGQVLCGTTWDRC
jgi:teichoic acid transport system ATP-binding protein